MIKTIPAHPTHLQILDAKEIYEDPELIENCTAAIEAQRALTFVGRQGEILAIVGFTPIYNQTGEVWAITSKTVMKYPLAFGRKSKEVLENFIDKNKLKRVQIVVKQGYEEGFQYALFLGFQPEGILKSFGPLGDNYVMMGKVT